MPRTLRLAAIQMDATPAPTAERLARAEALIADAAAQGAQVVVLPELFNTGYHYHDANYTAAEPLDGPTGQWMEAQAARHGIYLSGTILLLDGDDIYNSALLMAPDGQIWRYDKNYPWLFERAYFREGQGITIAQTPYGKLGMLICWDAAHPELWQRYAGKVDAMLVMSCPPNMPEHDLLFPDGTRANLRDLMPGSDSRFPAEDMDAQARWMGVPVAATTGAGRFDSYIPLADLTVRVETLRRPDLWRHPPELTRMQADYYPRCTKIISGQGEVLGCVEQDADGVVVREVTLADHPPVPEGQQPPMHTAPLVYLNSDVIGPALLVPIYRAGVRRQWGMHMAPVDSRTRLGLIVMGVTGLAAFVVGWLLGRRR